MASLIERFSDYNKGVFTGSISVTVVILFLIYLWVKYPDNIKIVLSQIWYILSFVFKWAERKYVKTHIEGVLGKGIEGINREVRGLDADKIKIVMVQTKTREAFIRERTLVIKLQHRENQDENLANIAVLYTETCLYKKLELYLDEDQKQGINLYTAKSLLKNTNISALQFLHKNYYLPVAKDNIKIQEYFSKLEKIDDKGLFYGVFVQEMVFLGNKAYFNRKPSGINEEIEKFVDFLEEFSERERGEMDSRKTFIGVNIKVAFVLVALKEKREIGIADAYVGYIKFLLENKIESFYLLGRGFNTDFTNQVADVAGEKISDIQEINRIPYRLRVEDGESINALCILFRNKKIPELQDYIQSQYQYRRI